MTDMVINQPGRYDRGRSAVTAHRDCQQPTGRPASVPDATISIRLI
jgi:hypothetical protein